MTTGFVTNFEIRNDSLRIWDLERKGWHTYLIKDVTKDSLVLFDLNMQYDLTYFYYKNSEVILPVIRLIRISVKIFFLVLIIWI